MTEWFVQARNTKFSSRQFTYSHFIDRVSMLLEAVNINHQL